MGIGLDTFVEFPQLSLIHQKLPDREVGRHSHDEHELFIPLQGEIRVYEDGFDCAAGPGKMLYVPPKIEHRFTSSAYGAGERVILLISDKLWKKLGGLQSGPRVLPAHSLIRELVFYLLMNSKAAGVKSFVEALVVALIEQMDSAAGLAEGATLEQLESKVEDKRVLKALRALSSVDEQPSIAEIARQSGLSSRNLNRVFLAEVGMTPKQFAILAKVSAAQKLLLTTRLTVTDIAMEVGYNSLSKFIASFQKLTGVLPSEYRETRGQRE